MTATVLPFRRRPAAPQQAPRPPAPTQPCGAGTQPGGIGVAVCGRTPAKLFACGWRCPDHYPKNSKTGHPDHAA